MSEGSEQVTSGDGAGERAGMAAQRKGVSCGMILCCTWMVVAVLSFGAHTAAAADLGAEGSPLSVEVHAFVGQGFVQTTSNNYLDSNTTHGSFQLSDVGINFTKTLVDRLRVGVQLFAQNLGPTGNYNARMDWFYVDYRWRDWLGFRAGRVKIPFGLYNEVNDIDSARTFILLPQSVYPIDNRNYLLAQTGGELYGYQKLGSGGGALDYRGYAGTIFLDTTTQPGSPYQLVSVNVPYLVGGRVLWETPIDGLRMGGSVQGLRLDLQALTQMKLVTVEAPVILWVGSVEYSAHDLLLAAEYSRWYVKASTSDPTLFPASPLTTSERAYGMVGYRATKWLQPGVYYSVLYPNVDDRAGRQNRQHDLAATIRLDINSNWLVKLEGHWMQGTAGLNSSLNNNTPLSALDRYWGVFLVKTTAYF
jgi:hypothetical protein